VCSVDFCRKSASTIIRVIIITITIIIIINEFMYRDTTNVEPEMCDYINKNWNHWNSNEKLKEKFGSLPGKHSIDSLQKTVILGT